MTGILAALAGGGSAAPVVTINDQPFLIDSIGVGTADSRYYLRPSGNAEHFTSTLGFSVLETWVEPTGAAGGDYEARATLVGGIAPNVGNSTGVWHPLSIDVFFGVTSSVYRSTTLDIEIRDAATQTILDLARVTITAEAA